MNSCKNTPSKALCPLYLSSHCRGRSESLTPLFEQATDAARGLLYLHSKDIVHGDLKAVSTLVPNSFPHFNFAQANILIDNAGTAVLCDFGLSRIKADMTSRTPQREIVTLGPGSRNWMSPELLRGALPRKSSDIYALGMTIYEVWRLA